MKSATYKEAIKALVPYYRDWRLCGMLQRSEYLNADLRASYRTAAAKAFDKLFVGVSLVEKLFGIDVSELHEDLHAEAYADALLRVAQADDAATRKAEARLVIEMFHPFGSLSEEASILRVEDDAMALAIA